MVNVLKTNEWYTLNEWVVYIENYISIKVLQKQAMAQASHHHMSPRALPSGGI